jgi:hypothetical protein
MIVRSLEDSLHDTVVAEGKQSFCNRILIVDDDRDVTITLKVGIQEGTLIILW